jgi:hypothetical protein
MKDLTQPTKPKDVHWKLAYDLSFNDPKVKVHHVEWDPENEVLNVYVFTGRKKALDKYVAGSPLYERDEMNVEHLVGMNPYELGDPPQTLVREYHIDRAKSLGVAG